jgi:SAM-dependent methyltransferase
VTENGDINRELGAFANVDATDAKDFISRLDRMQSDEGFGAYKRQSFESLGLTSGAKVADIGCGAGHDAAALARLVGPEGHATGVDVSSAMIEEADKRFAETENLNFLAAPADALPFETGSLDAIRADRVLIHVPDPIAAIKEMLRVLRPGGRIALSEPDMLGFWVASSDPQISAVVSGAIANSCLHPNLPRDMSVMLRDLRLGSVKHLPLAMITDDFSFVDQVVRFELVAQAIAAKGVAPADRVEGWVTDLIDRRENGRFCAGLTIVTVAATKPEHWQESAFPQLT